MNRGLEATSPSFVRGCVNVLRKAIRRLHRTNRDVPELRWELAEVFGRIESSRTEEIRSIDSWTRNDGIPGAVFDRFTCAVDLPGVSDRVDFVRWSTPAGYTAFPYCWPLSPTSGSLPFGRITAQFHEAGTGVLRNDRHDE